MNTGKFHAGRTFYQSSTDTTTNGWYFMVRGGNIYGPFLTREEMGTALRTFVKASVATGETGGRRSRYESAA